MKSIYTIVSLMCISPLVSLAQSESLRITGKVFDETKAPASYADIRLYRSSDSSFVSGVPSAEDGSFEIKAENGKYYATVSLFGLSSKIISISKQTGEADLGSVYLKATAVGLKEVTVTADQNQMSLKIDKRVFNVAADLNNQGANATEVLQNIPSITVDAEGNVSLRGSQNVRILIDGKLSGFASSADALQQLQSDMIDKIEVITNASARYDAQGESGIINIILKKNQKAGFNGSVTLRTGYYPDHGVGINANYRTGKFNFFGSYTLSRREHPGTSYTDQRVQNADTGFAYHQDYRHERKKWGNNGSFGFDYMINDKNTLSVTASVRSGLGNNVYYRTYENYDLNNTLLSTDQRDEANREMEDLFEGSIAYTRKFNKPGMEWKTELKGFRDQDYERSNYTETSTRYAQTELEYSKTYVTEQNLLLQSDLTIPFAKDGKVELGGRSQNRYFLNEFRFGEMNAGNWETPQAFNDDFDYVEKVHAGYVMASNTFGKLGMQAGLRGEYSDIRTRQQSQGQWNKKEYMNWFPSAAISYQYSKQKTFQLSYSRRINRPGQWDLMPFMKFGDNREMRVGNPNLNPEYTDALEFSFMQNWDKGSLLSSVYYRKTTDKIERMASYGSDGIIYRIPLNVADRNAYGLELNGNYTLSSWARVTSGFNFFKEVVFGTYQNQHFEVNNFSWTNRTSFNFTLPQRWRIQVSGNYEAPKVNPQGRSLAVYFADFGMTKDILRSKATIGLNVNDVFNTRKWRSITETAEIYSESMFQWRPRSIRLVFNYRFNQQPKDHSKMDDMMDGEA
ncbi:TonB-dependent receptor domain-containing protein [Edaphocola flava]|uniref:TonB-dependent receptor domain-containing protein n=1 Tax=Edaphocola flava TaxID=2499629 RepID=UPI00100BFEAE|nr:TonB-dependent receptor [Edaphocola flava]